MAQIDIKKKLTCAFGIKAPLIHTLVIENGGRVYSGRLVGIANGTKTGVSEFGEWTCLVGSFQFTDRFGVASRAVQAFGPDVVISPVVAALESGAVNVNVAVDVYAVRDEKSPVGFVYTCASAIEESASDPLQLLLAQANAVPMPTALPAPEKKAPGRPSKG